MVELKVSLAILLVFICSLNKSSYGQSMAVQRMDFVGLKGNVLFTSQKTDICDTKSDANGLAAKFCKDSPTVSWLLKKHSIKAIKLYSIEGKVVIAKPMTIPQESLPVADVYFVVNEDGSLEMDDETIIFTRFKLASKKKLDSLLRSRH